MKNFRILRSVKGMLTSVLLTLTTFTSLHSQDVSGCIDAMACNNDSTATINEGGLVLMLNTTSLMTMLLHLGLCFKFTKHQQYISKYRIQKAVLSLIKLLKDFEYRFNRDYGWFFKNGNKH